MIGQLDHMIPPTNPRSFFGEGDRERIVVWGTWDLVLLHPVCVLGMI